MSSDDNLQKTISFLEQAEIEIKEAVTAQTAMINSIPYYLEKNLASLRRYFPNIYEKFKNYILNDNYKLTCNSNGEPNILYPDGHLFYTKKPFSDCKKQVDDYVNNFYKWTIIPNVNQDTNTLNQIHFHYQNKLFSKVNDLKRKLLNLNMYKKQKKQQIFESVPIMFMFGVGLGFHIGYLYERITPINLYIIEPCSDFFYLSLFFFINSSSASNEGPLPTTKSGTDVYCSGNLFLVSSNGVWLTMFSLLWHIPVRVSSKKPEDIVIDCISLSSTFHSFSILSDVLWSAKML